MNLHLIRFIYKIIILYNAVSLGWSIKINSADQFEFIKSRHLLETTNLSDILSELLLV